MIVAACLAGASLAARSARAHSNGVAFNDCSNCHYNATNATSTSAISFAPSSGVVGATVNVTVTNAGPYMLGGFSLRSSGGAFPATQPVGIKWWSATNVSHSATGPNSWTMPWAASTPGTYTFDVYGNVVNGDGKIAGDYPSTMTTVTLCVASAPATVCGARACGSATDECGATVSCGTCPSGQTCSAAGTCGCTPTWSCTGKCGSVVDSCGGAHDCGTCVAPQTCGGGGTANVCGCTPSWSCTGRCGSLVDNCGGAHDCGTCAGDELCNATTNACYCPAPACASGDCGTKTNGCGQSTFCGACDAGSATDAATSDASETSSDANDDVATSDVGAEDATADTTDDAFDAGDDAQSDDAADGAIDAAGDVATDTATASDATGDDSMATGDDASATADAESDASTSPIADGSNEAGGCSVRTAHDDGALAGSATFALVLAGARRRRRSPRA